VQSVQNAAARLLTNTRRRDHNHSGVATTSLAAGPETTGVQDCVSCTPIARFNGADLSALYTTREHDTTRKHGP